MRPAEALTLEVQRCVGTVERLVQTGPRIVGRLNTPPDRRPASPRSYVATASACGLQGKQRSLANLEHSAILAPDTQTPVVCTHRITGSAVEDNHI